METFQEGDVRDPEFRRLSSSELISELKNACRRFTDRKNELARELEIRDDLEKLGSHGFDLRHAVKALTRDELKKLRAGVELALEAAQEIDLQLEHRSENRMPFRVSMSSLPLETIEQFWTLVRDLSMEFPTEPREVGPVCFRYRLKELAMRLEEEYAELRSQERIDEKELRDLKPFDVDAVTKARRKEVYATSLSDDEVQTLLQLEHDTHRKWNPFNGSAQVKLTRLRAELERRVDEKMQKEEIPKIETKRQKYESLNASIQRRLDVLGKKRRDNNTIQSSLGKIQKEMDILAEANVAFSLRVDSSAGAENEVREIEQIFGGALKRIKLT
ncbi:MAG TPA: hypothetical protein VGZ00_02160 [Candidatus Baltobacteraceae bacterium]|jgi:hypothetical protein|nr:hypothetical protein [Candidatus Baltobacteraceae bacterium]